MSDNDWQKYDKIRQAASKNWLRPASVSLQRLDEVRTNIYNLDLTDGKQLKTSPDHGTKPGQQDQIENTKPPISKLSIQKNVHAWGGSGSIPNLIRNQMERQRNRPESAKVSRQNRPPSGKKQRPQSAKETATNKNDLSSGVVGHIAVVTGSRCDKSSRPDGTSVHLAGTGWVAPPNDTNTVLQDVMDEQDNYEYLYRADAEMPINREEGYLEYVGGLPREDGAPPPPPRGSPDFMQMLESEGPDVQNQSSYGRMITSLLDHRDGNTPSVKPPTQLLRKPKPEPIQFSVPTGEVEDEVSFSFDENGILVNKLKHGKHNEAKKQISKKKTQTKSETVSESRSPQTLISGETDNKQPDVEAKLMPSDDELYSHPRRVEVNVIIEDPGGPVGGGLQVNLAPLSNTQEDSTTKDQPNVQFDEEKNTTIEITPRQSKKHRPQSAKSATHSGRRDLRYVKSRTDSGVALNLVKPAKKSSQDDENSNSVESSGNGAQDRHLSLVGNRPKSGHSRNKLNSVTVNYMDSVDEFRFEHERWKPKKFLRKPPEVETCMSHYYSSDDNDLDLSIEGHSADESKPRLKDLKSRPQSATVISGPRRNYFEMMRSARRPTSDSEGEDTRSKVKTIKTIELTGDGLVKETVVVSTIDALEQKGRTEFVAPRPSSAKKNRPSSAKTGAVTMEADWLSRNGPELGDVENGIQGDSVGFSVRPNKRRPRVSSAPVNRPPDALAQKIAEIHKSVYDRPKAQPCGCKGSRHSHSHSTCNIAKMASRDRSARRYYTGFADKQEKPELEVPERVVEIWTRQADYEIETDGVRECKELHERLIQSGVPVTLEALKRGLLPPTEYGFAGPTYKSTVHPNLRPNYTDSLLDNPSTSWLSEEHKHVQLAKKKVREATQALEQQRIEEAREALAAEARAMKQGRRKTNKKHKKKRPKSVM